MWQIGITMLKMMKIEMPMEAERYEQITPQDQEVFDELDYGNISKTM